MGSGRDNSNLRREEREIIATVSIDLFLYADFEFSVISVLCFITGKIQARRGKQETSLGVLSFPPRPIAQSIPRALEQAVREEMIANDGEILPQLGLISSKSPCLQRGSLLH